MDSLSLFLGRGDGLGEVEGMGAAALLLSLIILGMWTRFLRAPDVGSALSRGAGSTADMGSSGGEDDTGGLLLLMLVNSEDGTDGPTPFGRPLCLARSASARFIVVLIVLLSTQDCLPSFCTRAVCKIACLPVCLQQEEEIKIQVPCLSHV